MTTSTLEDVKTMTSRPATRDFLKKKKASTRDVEVLLDTDLIDVYDRIQARIEEGGTAAQLRVLKSELDAVKAEITENTVIMKFRSIGRKAYEELVDEHPATPEQLKESESREDPPPPYNTDTFPRALIQLSCLDPELTAEDTDEIYDTWNQGEVMELFMAALLVNTQRRTVDLGNGSGPTRN